MPRRDRDRLLDILEGIDKVEEYATEGLRDAEPGDPRWDAILYNLVIVGEAARNVSEEVRALAPEIDWRGPIGMPNVITHGYFAMKRDIVSSTLETDLPTLRQTVDRLLRELPEG